MEPYRGLARRRPGPRMIMRGVVLATAGGVLTWTVTSAAAQPPLTRVSLDEALQLALRQNPTVRAKAMELQSVKANEITAALRPNPTASYAAEQFGLAGSDPQHTVVVSQTIELGGKRQRRIESARAATRVTGFQLEDVRRDFLDAQRTYRETALALLQAMGAYWAALYQLEADIGRPLDGRQ